jgi:hypothetical protein
VETRASRGPAWVLALLAIAGTLPVLRSLIVPDLNWCYRYMSSDSYDWIANGLYLAGENVRSNFRPPALPLAIAGLWRLEALPWLPVLNFLALGASVAALWALLREQHGPWVVAIACWFFFANEAVQDTARYVLAETLATPSLVIAALAFVRAGRDPRWYVLLGAALGAGFLASYVTAPAAAGFGIALLVRHREDFRKRALWEGVVIGAVIVAGWILVRARHYALNPDGPRHGVEAILRPSLSNVGFYLFSATAVTGLLPLPLVLWGLVRTLRRHAADTDRHRLAVLGTLASVGGFWAFLYDWADRRFLVYLVPFLACLFAEGVVGLGEFGRRTESRWRRAAAVAAVGAALLWNQIRYPSYGFQYLALTPKHFLVMGLTSTKTQKAVIHWNGARVERLRPSFLAGFGRGLFDPGQKSPECPAPDRECLGRLKKVFDSFLAPGEPVGLLAPRTWSTDDWGNRNRLGNALLRPVLPFGVPRMAFAGVDRLDPHADFTRPPFASACGNYAVGWSH